jgi:hypothetical protein
MTYVVGRPALAGCAPKMLEQKQTKETKKLRSLCFLLFHFFIGRGAYGVTCSAIEIEISVLKNLCLFTMDGGLHWPLSH